ncbi:hypothetical protein BH10CYA1_BH10CYA1_45910 [soil metagenome]
MNQELLRKKGVTNQMENLIWILALVSFYFVLQLWILPKLGIQT